ncbi:MAG: T9SS type A sorting domain-containing protein, partial [candidate division Zixibacteria bacterium]|nr:T9SS type A sorting domain-containing protein [candidate division Zixibacteria bacterium]
MRKIALIAFVIGALMISISVTAEEVVKKPVVRSVLNPIEQPETPCDVQENLLAYDTAPTFYYPTYNQDETMVSVRFTPEQTCSLISLKIASYGEAGPALIHIWEDDGNGKPGNDLVTPFQKSLSGNMNYQTINLAEAIDIGDADFHAGIEYTRVPPPYFTSDGDGVTENRSNYKLPSESWTTLEHDANIRAVVQYYGEDIVAPTINHVPITMGFTQIDPAEELVSATITDDAGVSEAYVYYNPGDGYVSVPMDNVTGNVWEASIPSGDPGTQISYYIEATDNSDSANTGYFPAEGEDDPIEYTIVDGSGISYDDGDADGWWICSDTWDDNAFAVRCTPSIYPVTVIMLRAYVNGNDPFEFTVNGISGDNPGDVLAGPWSVTPSSAPGWVDFEIPPGDQIEIASGDFCAVFHWLESTPADPGVGGDDSSPDSLSYWRHGSWNMDYGNDFMLRSVVFDSSWNQSGVEELGGGLPVGFALEQNFPNPFNASTNITYGVDTKSGVNLSVYNLAGQLVETLVDDIHKPGVYTVRWNAEEFSSGVYFYRLEA